MKILLCLSVILSSFHVLASEDGCKTKALEVSKAINKVYSPKQIKGTKSSISELGKTENSRLWLVSIQLPNAEGATIYNLEMQKVSCEVINLNMIFE